MGDATLPIRAADSPDLDRMVIPFGVNHTPPITIVDPETPYTTLLAPIRNLKGYYLIFTK
jgi:hypothetical protein